jgi:demethylspheroidene O-methyltransferase
MIEHHTMLYGDLNDPVALLRGQGGGRLARYWPYAGSEHPAELPSDAVAPYTALMSASQPMIAQEVINAYSFRKHRCLLDIGGGDGAFLSAVATHAPNLRMVLFDLPAVADQASERFRSSGLAPRAVAIGGSFLSDRLPEGADIVSLVRIVHDHDDANVMKLLRAVRRILPDDGTLLIAEPMSGLRGTESIGDAYFAFYLMAMGSGRPRNFARLSEMLEEAGFGRVTLLPAGMPLLTSVVVAHPAEITVNQT